MDIIDKIRELEGNKFDSYVTVHACGLAGVEAYPVEIEIFISSGIPSFHLVGLPDTAINESKERVRAAIKSCGFEFPSKKITVNLAPADTKKAGPSYDLAIAIGIIACLESELNEPIIKRERLKDLYIIGELGLSGKVRRINGVLSSVILAKKKKIFGIIIPEENKNEAKLIRDINIYPSQTLKDVIDIINNIENISPLESQVEIKNTSHSHLDLKDVKGQEKAKRALEISASGNHNLLMIGSPGSGKTMLAERIKTILPELKDFEKIEITQIYSSCGKLSKQNGLIDERPFRSPHHSISTAGLIGGGSSPLPGEITLAHHGILFLDEFTEFQKSTIEGLRQAVENKIITVTRASKSITFPCNFTLIAACNPCPCGYLGDKYKSCSCNKNAIERYKSKLSGPILDRIDLQVEVKRLSSEDLTKEPSGKSSKELIENVLTAIKAQAKRGKSNSKLSPIEMKEFCTLDKDCLPIIRDATSKYLLTGRSYDRVLKVSRTIADLDESENIKEKHLLEALQYRLVF